MTDPYAVRATIDLGEWLLLERAFCTCDPDGLCTCGWDDVE